MQATSCASSIPMKMKRLWPHTQDQGSGSRSLACIHRNTRRGLCEGLQKFKREGTDWSQCSPFVRSWKQCILMF